jgi:hypothetical protein
MGDKEQKILEKYQELGNPARTVLVKMVANPSLSKRWSKLRRDGPLMNDKVLKEGIDQLLKFKLIIKKDKKYFLDERYKWQISLIARKQSDKINLDSYLPNEIINESTLKTKVTIYGLKSEVFRATEKNSRNLDLDKKEVLEFTQGIKSSELVGKTQGIPLILKNKLKDASEEEIINEEVKYYLNLIKKGAKKEEIIKNIISRHRSQKISFKEAGENLTQKILEIKKKHRKRKIKEDFKSSLKEEKSGKIKRVLKKFEEEFILILNHDDSPLIKGEIEQAIFTWHGYGRGLYSKSGFSADKEKLRRNDQFTKTIDNLSEEEKGDIMKFLKIIIKRNQELYPTHVSILCRTNSSDIMPFIKPKIRKSTP